MSETVWDSIPWTETGDRTFFGVYHDYPVVKVVCRERTYILPACYISKFYREIALDVLEGVTDGFGETSEQKA